jgi:hypothetical protein
MKNKLSKEFSPIPNSNYSINEYGEVINNRNKIILNPFFISEYSAVNISVNGKRKTCYLHHLVALVFLDYTAKRGLMSLNHIDGNKRNPRLDNIELITHRLNSTLTHTSRNRLLPTGVTLNPIGKRRYKAQLSYLGKNRYLGMFHTAEEASAVYQEAVQFIIKTGVLPDYFFTRQRYERFKKPE